MKPIRTLVREALDKVNIPYDPTCMYSDRLKGKKLLKEYFEVRSIKIGFEKLLPSDVISVTREIEASGELRVIQNSYVGKGKWYGVWGTRFIVGRLRLAEVETRTPKFTGVDHLVTYLAAHPDVAIGFFLSYTIAPELYLQIPGQYLSDKVAYLKRQISDELESTADSCSETLTLSPNFVEITPTRTTASPFRQNDKVFDSVLRPGMKGQVTGETLIGGSDMLVVRFEAPNGDIHWCNYTLSGSHSPWALATLSFKEYEPGHSILERPVHFDKYERVLMRDHESTNWIPMIFESQREGEFKYKRYDGGWFRQCIKWDETKLPQA